MENKNHDYGEAPARYAHQLFTDLILMKLLRVKQIEENEGKTIISEGMLFLIIPTWWIIPYLHWSNSKKMKNSIPGFAAYWWSIIYFFRDW